MNMSPVLPAIDIDSTRPTRWWKSIKYRALAAAAYETGYAAVDALARDCDVRLVGVERQDVLRRVA